MTSALRQGHQAQSIASPPHSDPAASTSARAGRVRVMSVISDLSVGGSEMMLYKLLAGTDLSRFEPVVVSLMGGGGVRSRGGGLGGQVYTGGGRRRRPTLV